MTTYAMIDSNSGYVWGVQEADNPIEACRQMDHDLGEYGRVYDEVSRYLMAHTTKTGYLVHQAPDGWTCDNGQDPENIEAVEAMPFVIAVEVVSGAFDDEDEKRDPDGLHARGMV